MGDTPPRIVGHRHFTPEERAAFQAGAIYTLAGAVFDIIEYADPESEGCIELLHQLALLMHRRRHELPYKVREKLITPTHEIERRTEDTNKSPDLTAICQWAGEIQEVIRLAVNDSNLC